MSYTDLPVDKDLEHALLGSVIVDPEAIKDLATILKPDHFFYEGHRQVYKACLSLLQDGIAINQPTLSRRIDELGMLKYESHRALVFILMEKALDVTKNARFYAESIIDLYRRREAIIALRQGITDFYDPAQATNTTLAGVAERVFDLALEREARAGLAPLSSSLPDALRAIETARKGGGSTRAVPWPWAAVARLVPLRQGEVTVVAGRPGMAKTSLVLGALLALADKQIPVALFSLEMNKRQIILRCISYFSKVNSQRIEKGEYSDEEFERITNAITHIGQLPILIEDSPDLDEASFMANSQLAVQRFSTRVIAVDYLQLMTRRTKLEEVQAIGSCARTIRKTARLLDLPIIEISQISRATEGRENRRPQLSDLRGSGEIEQEADVVLGLYRDEYYTGEKSNFPNQCEVIVLKHRNGSLGTARLFFERTTTRFTDLASFTPNGVNGQQSRSTYSRLSGD